MKKINFLRKIYSVISLVTAFKLVIFLSLSSILLFTSSTTFASRTPRTIQIWNINGKNVACTNLTTSTSDARAALMISLADTPGTGPTGVGMISTGDRVVITDKYIAWFDYTPTTNDPHAGGMLRGIWTMTGVGESLNFRPNGNYNELLPNTHHNSAKGAGHVLLLQIDTAYDISYGGASSLSFFSTTSGISTPAFDSATDYPYLGGWSIQANGYLKNMFGSSDLNPNNPVENPAMFYEIRYSFSPDSDKIVIETNEIIHNTGTAAPVYVLINNFDTMGSSLPWFYRPMIYGKAETSAHRQQEDGLVLTGNQFGTLNFDVNPQVSFIQDFSYGQPNGAIWYLSESSDVWGVGQNFGNRAFARKMISDPYNRVKQRQQVGTRYFNLDGSINLDVFSLTVNAVNSINQPITDMSTGWSWRYVEEISTFGFGYD